MSKFLSVFIILICISCNSSEEKKKQTNVEVEEIASEVNTKKMIVLVDDPEEEGSKMLLGSANCKALQSEPFNTWFVESHNAHALDTLTLTKIQPLLRDVKIKIFMGTWCEDSQRETPALYKILDAINFNYDNLDLVAVSRDKDTPQGLEEGLDIEYVPTFIFYKDEKELGRFVEYAQETLEKDMYAILSGADYKHAYAE